MYQRRVSKAHPRVEATGSVDELNSALGMARALAGNASAAQSLRAVQQDLVTVMGELATVPEDLERYTRDGYPRVTPALTAKLDHWVQTLETQKPAFRGWAIPGDSPAAAALDVARAVCRRAERRVCALANAGQLPNPEILVFLNRLSDALWLLARWAEGQAAPGVANGGLLTAPHPPAAGSGKTRFRRRFRAGPRYGS
ncbi:MAG: cob(I)yrinic acid a,c-diamide adenosyltransferase [Verrucomicrobia bacterium]|nr:cob(I)yrinic acid a,c-diamide adenosyltransferase [Verrucomicrobiota bacterium]